MTFTFVGGNLALDLVGTLAERDSTAFEQLSSGPDLARWLVESGVLGRRPVVGPGDLERAVRLREALHRLVVARTEGTPLRPGDLAVVNETAAGALPSVHVTRGGNVRRTGDVPAGLTVVARTFADLLEDPDALLRFCEGQDCTRPFVDRSRGHRRRWCGMAGCGDRAKAAAYRARQRR